MATKKSTVVSDAQETVTTEQSVEPVQFEKEQILASEKYRHNRDVVDALLDDKKKYTLETVDKLINNYMKGTVK